MPLPQKQVPFPRQPLRQPHPIQPLRQPHPIQPRPPQQRAAKPHPYIPTTSSLETSTSITYNWSAMAAYVPMRLN